MKTWSGGYIADVEYIDGFYGQQSPASSALACLLGGVAMEVPGPYEAAHYLELGCGRGMGALVTAASNPGWRVTAVDYNPTHVALGTAMARAAGLQNISFLEVDLATLAGSAASRAIPSADFVSLHGVWTWVGPAVRAGIVRLLAEKVRPGGAVHITYNAMPAWQAALGMQRMIYEAGNRVAARSDRQALAGVELSREMRKAGAVFLSDERLVGELLDRTDAMMPQYLAHEYMNTHWAPAFHADVAAAMADAKLDWVAAANPLENFTELMLSAEQRVAYDRTEDPIMRELIKDVCLPRQLRQDVFVRGARRMPNVDRDATIAQITLTPIVSRSELLTTIDVPAGKAEMSDDLKTMMAALMDGPATVGALLATNPGRSNPCELIGVLVGSRQAQIVVAPETEQPETANQLNRVLGSQVRSLLGPQTSAALASGRLGTGLTTPRLVQFIAGRLLSGESVDDRERWVEVLGADVAHEHRHTVRGLIDVAVEQRVPLLRQNGIVP